MGRLAQKGHSIAKERCGFDSVQLVLVRVCGLLGVYCDGMRRPSHYGAVWNPFILVGLYLLFGRFVSRARSLSSTHYVVTDQRLLFLYRKNTQFLLYQNIETLEKEQTKDDRGTIYFSPRNFYYDRTCILSREHEPLAGQSL